MFALFYDDDKSFIAAFESRVRAIALGKRLSLEKARAVIAVKNDSRGATEIFWRFEQGEETPLESQEDQARCEKQPGGLTNPALTD